ncbi:MAG: hypothetical protein J6Z08_00255 [Elusimicrobiales bacterium]|nr:hypothetical protein [Elusimicrobiales bacterium]
MGRNLTISLFAGISVFVYEAWIKGFLAAHSLIPGGLPRSCWDGIFTAVICMLILILLKKLKLC